MWVDCAVTLPVDAQTVWVRMKLYAIETPLAAVYHSASLSFTMPNGQLLPWYFCSKWMAR